MSISLNNLTLEAITSPVSLKINASAPSSIFKPNSVEMIFSLMEDNTVSTPITAPLLRTEYDCPVIFKCWKRYGSVL